jgi:hypothetical protein
MLRAARTRVEEYWRPADPETARIAGPILAEDLCRDCGAEYSAGARFCHICGGKRNQLFFAPSRPMTFADYFDVTMLGKRFCVSIPSLVFFFLGIACIVIACSLGLLYKSETLVQWQALQFWRIEWLLGAAGAILAGILLKK